jgi:hypothetical protein
VFENRRAAQAAFHEGKPGTLLIEET